MATHTPKKTTKKGAIPVPTQNGTQLFKLETHEFKGSFKNYEVTLALRALLGKVGIKANNSFIVPSQNYSTARTLIRKEFAHLKMAGQPTDASKKFYRLTRLK